MLLFDRFAIRSDWQCGILLITVRIDVHDNLYPQGQHGVLGKILSQLVGEESVYFVMFYAT